MADEEIVSPEKLAETLKATGAVGRCPVCGHEEGWTLLNQEEESIGPVAKKAGQPADNFVPSLVIVCRNCGFLSQHASYVLNQRLANENKERGGG